MPECLDIHHILDAVATAEIAREEGCEHIAVTEGLRAGAASVEERVNGFPDTGAVEPVEN